MNPYVTACLIALLIILPIVAIIHNCSSRKSNTKQAAKEYRCIVESIAQIETRAEFDFWRHEAASFLSRYRGTIHPRLILMYEAMIATAFKFRMEKGFEKQLVTDKL